MPWLANYRPLGPDRRRIHVFVDAAMAARPPLLLPGPTGNPLLCHTHKNIQCISHSHTHIHTCTYTHILSYTHTHMTVCARTFTPSGSDRAVPMAGGWLWLKHKEGVFTRSGIARHTHTWWASCVPLSWLMVVQSSVG